MTTYTAFAPPSNITLPPFQFQPTLDGVAYTAVVTWSLSGQRWMLTITTLQGALVLATALAGSPPLVDINLAAGFFTTSTLAFRQSTSTFEVNP